MSLLFRLIISWWPFSTFFSFLLLAVTAKISLDINQVGLSRAIFLDGNAKLTQTNSSYNLSKNVEKTDTFVIFVRVSHLNHIYRNFVMVHG